jgi:hypothetical protein
MGFTITGGNCDQPFLLVDKDTIGSDSWQLAGMVVVVIVHCNDIGSPLSHE